MRILFIDTAHPLLIGSLLNDGHECIEAYDWSREKILSSMKGIDGVCLRSRILLDKEFFDASTDLKFVARAGAGMESIDVAYAKSKNVACLSSPEGNRDAVAEHAIGMLLSLFNNLNKADREVRDGKWIREANRGNELNGKTVGIIGYGNMGSTFAKRLRGFDCKILVYDKYVSGFSNEYVTEVPIDEIYHEAEVLSLHVPLTKETEYMMNEEFINRFKNPFYLINTARGKCVRTSDLVNALKSGKIAGTCLDVLEYEDLSFEKFSIHAAGLNENPDWNYLISSDNVILSPHIAGWTFESLEKIAFTLLTKIRRFANDQKV